MRKTRWALLVLLVAAVGVVAGGYFVTQKRNRLLAPAKPAPLPGDLNSAAKNWSWSRSVENRPVAQVRARDFRQVKDSSRVELTDVELKVFSKTGETYNLVQSRRAEFDQSAEKLSSEGEVTMTLGLPAASPPEPGKRHVEIRTSGLTYDNKTGVSSTDRPVHFRFENGEASSTGAVYNPAKHYLWMKSDVDVIGAGAQAGMRIRAGELHYYEAEQKIELRPWSRLERGGQGVEAAASTIYLDKGDLKRIEAQQGKGFDHNPNREIRFSGDALELNFTPERTLATAAGIGNARAVSESATGVTTITGDRVDLEFSTSPGAEESELAIAYVRGSARVESTPAVPKDKPRPETKILTADMVKLAMWPGGRDVQEVETLSPGSLEFLPNQPAQWKRTLTAERIKVQYLPGNHPESLLATGKAHLRSDPPAAGPAVKPGSRPPPPRLTWSDVLEAFFDPQSGQMRELRQSSHFRYEEGARRAQAGGARFNLPNDEIILDSAVRVWDETSLTTAGLLVLDQKRDQLRAEGNVASTHQEKGSAGAMFSADRPLHATAQRLESEQRNRLLHYRGAARLWQDGNSIQAEEIDLDREAKTLQARGGVVSVLVEEKQGRKPERPGGPSKLVTITADSLLYTDEDRRAFYTGHVVLRRDRLLIRSSQLEAYLRPEETAAEKGQSRVERALARGSVQIVETAAASRAPRKAAAEQAEYISGEEKVTLRGGTATLEQPGRSLTRGAELTYYIDDDRLLVNGRPGARSETHQNLKRN